MTSPFNLTPNRLKALRFIADHPGWTADHLAAVVSPDKRWRAQGATRFGCSYAVALIRAGLVRSVTFGVTAGWAQLHLTAAGHAALSSGETAAGSAEHLARAIGSGA